MDDTAFDYLKPTDEQLNTMAASRKAFKELAEALDDLLPEGPDKTHTMRLVRTAAMWANVAITRDADGSPRS